MVVSVSWILHNLPVYFSNFPGPSGAGASLGDVAAPHTMQRNGRAPPPACQAPALGYHGGMKRFFPGTLSLLLTLCAAVPAAWAQAVPDTMARRTMACTACHGEQGRATSDGYFPRIAGKPAGYLYNQLLNFREGRRTYPMMTYMVDHLSDDYLREMAEYFSGLHPPYAPPQPLQAPAAMLERGRQLALEGDKTRNVPACIACHGDALTGVAPAVPGLIGLPRDYLNGQFGAWKNGTRHAAKPDCMAELAGRLTVEDISAVSAWLSLQPAPPDAQPQAAATRALPLECGSIRQAQGAQR
jgi:cytochrome c553